MLKLLIIGIFLFSVGCVTPYRPKGLMGGYYSYKISNGRYNVGFTGNGFTGFETVKEFAFQRARQVCLENGYDDYQIYNQQGKTRSISSEPDKTVCSGSLMPGYSNSYDYNSECHQEKGSQYQKHNFEIEIECK